MLRAAFTCVISAIVVSGSLEAQCTPSVLVTYFSQTGRTRVMADAVADGARAVSGTDVTLLPIDSTRTEHLLAADAVILGTPVYNGNVAPQVLAFVNRWPFLEGEMRDKLGAAFVAAGGMSAGEEATLLSIHRAMLVHGMLIVGGPDWMSAFGASAVTEEPPFTAPPGTIDEVFLAKARGLGQRVASFAHRMVCP